MKNITRRDLIKNAAITSGLTLLPSGLYAAHHKKVAANDKIRVACIGIGNRGGSAVAAAANEQLVALCDVDQKVGGASFKKHPDAKAFTDFREMMDKMGDQIDAVTVSSPDHVHFAHAMAAVEAGKHVYVEKPLCQTIEQTRLLHAAAKKAGVQTQMGNQGHSQDAIRSMKERVMAGQIGQINNAWGWTNRPAGWWPQGRQTLPETQPVPETLDWDLWRHGIEADYSTDYVPFKWRGWTMFGTGSLGDMACHILDPLFYAHDLGMPDWIEGEAEGGSEFSYPSKSTVKYHFPARDGQKEFILTWYEGEGNPPPRPNALEEGQEMGNPSGGTIWECEKETVMTNSHADFVQAIPEARHKALKTPEETLRRVKKGHFGDWFAAIRGEVEYPSSHFDYSAKLNELVLLGTIAQRVPGKKLLWDQEKGQFTNDETANKLVKSAIL